MPSRPRVPVGAHVFTAGGLASAALRQADEIGAEAVQVFVSNPRGWALSTGDPRQDDAFRAGCAERGLVAYVHAPYLVNLGSPTPATRERSVACLRHSLRRAAVIGARGVVFHAGSATAAGRRDDALAGSRELLLPLLDEAAMSGVRLLVEPTAGGGTALAATIDELAGYLDVLGPHEGLGVCLDTCHLHAAGHDLAGPAAMRATLTAAARVLPPGLVALVHANDSHDPCGSHRDRHQNIGHGTIGDAAFGEIFRHPLTTAVPVLVETPGDVEAHRRDIATLKALRDR